MAPPATVTMSNLVYRNLVYRNRLANIASESCVLHWLTR